MDVKQIAEELVAGCREHREVENLDKLYAPDAQSVEAFAPPGQDAVTQGIEGIKGKHAWWNENFEMHDGSVEGPYVNGDRFTVIFGMDITEKANGTRSQMKEVALYHVADGKIVREEFFY